MQWEEEEKERRISRNCRRCSLFVVYSHRSPEESSFADGERRIDEDKVKQPLRTRGGIVTVE